MAGNILLIETSTALCSAALAVDGAIAEYRESAEPRAHASMTAAFVKDVLDSRGMTIADCDAVCVSKGPGSYTGLRVGVSTAKGLCFGGKKPLLAVGTLDILVAQAFDEGLIPEDCSCIVPMVDARRMEVYSAVFGMDGRQLTETAPLVVDGSSFAGYLDRGTVLFIGDGAAKCQPVIDHPNARYCQCSPKASAMLRPALNAYKEKRFENTAYFEPFYLKQFVATVSAKKLF